MTDITTVPQTSIDADAVAGVAQFLAPVVTDLTALYVDGKQAHWHVRGINFQSIHELLDEIVDHARDYADTAAERVVALGLPLDVRIQTVGAKATKIAKSHLRFLMLRLSVRSGSFGLWSSIPSWAGLTAGFNPVAELIGAENYTPGQSSGTSTMASAVPGGTVSNAWSWVAGTS